MAVKASVYILIVPKDRREFLLAEEEYGMDLYGESHFIAEPVYDFDHSRRAPLIVFASFENGKITHVASGQKGISAGSGLVRLKLLNLAKLKRPVGFTEIASAVERKLQSHLVRKLEGGGLLPPKTLDAFVDRMLELDSTLSSMLARYSRKRRAAISEYSARERVNLALQKESVALALEVAGIPKDEILRWSPPEEKRVSFLDGLPGARVREDVMLLTDFSALPGFTAMESATHIGAKTFVSSIDSNVRVTVVMANRLPLEMQTGVDLIYFNERYRSFVLVQYKAMEEREKESEFRWKKGDQFIDEIQRMDDLMAELQKITSKQHPDSFRFSENPFFLKFCPRVVFNPDDKGMFNGIYLPLELWRRLDSNGGFDGVRGGKRLTFENVGRRINNSEFASLIGGSWVGTTIEQSSFLEKLIRVVLETGRTVTLAIKHGEPPSLS